MNKCVIIVIFVFVLVISIVSSYFYFQKKHKTSIKDTPNNDIQKGVTDLNMKLSSPSFTNNQMMPSIYTCDGENINPPLTIFGIPVNTRSLALIVDDPDVPNGDWVHWLVWNIRPDTYEIAQGSIPDGALQGVNDFGKNGYDGPCPPSGKHRYQFKLYALDTVLDLSESSRKEDLENALNRHILEQTMLMGFYQKKQ